MAEFTRTPDASSEKYPLAVRTALLCAAMGDALGYPLELLSAKAIAARGPLTGENELIFSDDTQLSCYTLDALTEVLEWNNQGTPADELACLWLAYLRWYRGMGFTPAAHAPFSLDREIDTSAPLTAREGPGQATLRALESGEMQTVAQNINPDALGTGALVRSCAFGFLPVAPERTVVLLAARAAALTHGHPEALASAAAYALLTRDVLAGACGSEQGKKNSIADSVRRVIDWCGSIPAEEAFPTDAALTREALVKALALQETEPTPEAVAEHFGTDWLCYTVLGIAVWNTLYCSARISAPGEGLQAGLMRAVSADSDSDSIGAITGTLLGAHVGTLGDAQPLLEKLRGAADVRAVADRYITQLGQTP